MAYYSLHWPPHSTITELHSSSCSVAVSSLGVFTCLFSQYLQETFHTSSTKFLLSSFIVLKPSTTVSLTTPHTNLICRICALVATLVTVRFLRLRLRLTQPHRVHRNSTCSLLIISGMHAYSILLGVVNPIDFHVTFDH